MCIRDRVALLLPLIAEQALSVTIGLADTLMVSSVGEAAVSGVKMCIRDRLHPVAREPDVIVPVRRLGIGMQADDAGKIARIFLRQGGCLHLLSLIHISPPSSPRWATA